MDIVHLVRDVGGAELGNLVGNAHEHHAGGKMLAQRRRTPGGRIAAIGAAGDPGAVRIDNPSFRQSADRVHKIVELLAGVIVLMLLGIGDAAARGAAIVWPESGIALAGGDLPRFGIARVPAIGTVRLRAAMDQHHQRPAAGRGLAIRGDQHALHHLAVARFVFKHALIGQLAVFQPAIVIGPERKRTVRRGRIEILRMIRRVGDQADAVPLRAQRHVAGDQLFRLVQIAQRFAVRRIDGQPALHALMDNGQDFPAREPFHVHDMMFRLRFDWLVSAGFGIGDHHDARRRIIDVDPGGQGDGLARGGERVEAQLAGRLDNRDRLAIRVQHMDLTLHVVIVDQRRRGDRNRQSLPVIGNHQIGKIALRSDPLGLRGRVGGVQTDAPEMGEFVVFFIDPGLEALVLQLLLGLVRGLLGDEIDRVAVRVPDIIFDIRIHAEDALRLAAIHGDRPDGVMFVIAAFGNEADRAAIGTPGDIRYALAAGDIGAIGALAPCDIKLAVRRAVFVAGQHVARRVDHIGDARSVRRNGLTVDMRDLRQILHAHGLGERRRGRQRGPGRQKHEFHFRYSPSSASCLDRGS